MKVRTGSNIDYAFLQLFARSGRVGPALAALRRMGGCASDPHIKAWSVQTTTILSVPETETYISHLTNSIPKPLFLSMIVDDRIDKYPGSSDLQSVTPNDFYQSPDSELFSQSFEAVARAESDQPLLPSYSPHRRSNESTLEQGGVSLEKRFTWGLSEKESSPKYGSKLDAEAAFQDDGRLQISFGHRLSKRLPSNYAEPVNEIGLDEVGFRDAPPMNVNIMIVGSRGDVQPYLALGQRLQKYGTPVLKGDIGKKQVMVAEIWKMLERCCLSCYEVDEGSPNEGGFVADAIISNPPTFAHIHCAEALGIPLLLSFTMPWCATAAFPHPLVNVKQSGSHEPNAVNYYSYTLVDMLTWQGLGHAINKFRTKKLGLPYLSTASAVTMIQRSAIPWTYCISPALIPKPQDWLTHIDVVGFYFLDLANNYVPPTDLFDFLASGEPPIYVGLVGHFRFGSIVLNDPQEMTRAILAGISQAGVRAIVSPGWGGLDETMVKAAGPHVFALGNAPHDWLFQHVSAVCHHGGAGTTAIGLKCGKPTIIVPFFGDQPWWAAQLAQQGAGPEPLDSRNLTSEGFAAAIRAALSPDTIEAAQRISEMINKEARWGQKRSGIISQASTVTQHAVGQVNYVLGIFRRLTMRMKVAFSAQVLADRGEIDMNKLKLYRSREYKTHASATDPISGTALPLLRVVNGFVHGVVKIGSSRPDKGVAKMVTSTVGGVQTVLQGVTEGLTNVPKLYGSEVRETKPVTGFASGIVEGGKGFAYGLYDGITGLVNEPGALGAAIGVGTGPLCLTGLGTWTFPSHTMILIDNKTDSTEIQPQTESLSQSDSYADGSEPAASSVILDIPASDSHEYLPEAAMRPPPNYSPTAVNLIDSSASGISYPTEKARLPEYSETVVTEATIRSDGRIQASFASSQGFPEGYAPPIYEPALEKDGSFNTPSMNINIMIVEVEVTSSHTFRLANNSKNTIFQYWRGPKQPCEYMFLNAGSVSKSDNIKKGDVEKNQSMISEIMERCLLSCYEDDKVSGEEPGFAADLIISNPQTFAHIHCAEALEYRCIFRSGYDPLRELVEFIESGEPPIYIGFGSIVLENSENMTIRVGAISQAGVRAIIATSPEGLDEGMIKDAGDDVFLLTADTPHDWLFERVSAVVHHGGTGTTAIGLKCGKPTVTVPFFGDQRFCLSRGGRTNNAPRSWSASHSPEQVDAEVLANAIRVAISPESREAARKIGDTIRAEHGPKNAVESIHRHLPLLNMRCDLDPNRVAVWYSPTHKLRLSAFAAQVLAEAGELDINKLELHRSREYETHIGPIDPRVAKLPSEPGKGATKMLSASTLGFQNTLQSAAEGMHNLPKVYGGEVRKHKKVTGIGSGFAQGGKEFALGLYDGFSDFFMEPVRGFKRGGVLGAIGGVGIGALNLTTKPTAGFMHAVSMPIEGTVREVKSLLNRQVGKDRIVTRYAQGVSAARSASEAERERVVRAFIERVSRGDSASTVNKEDKKGKGKAKIT
ncbi:Glycosyltransferase family 1 protein [Rhizoctonia solani]|uniref:Glycosyltransferase family 1 protein n=1 Tax=Rhizoctonia solani TaxID=456999 RepID=A0A8H7I699_9AGAM|nr:Glycosyltransferase family 1 protein [Rhizoctonia solani]